MSSDAIRDLFEDLLKQEEMMIDLYSRLLNEIKNNEITDSIRSIIKDETRHADNARKMLEILAE